MSVYRIGPGLYTDRFLCKKHSRYRIASRNRRSERSVQTRRLQNVLQLLLLAAEVEEHLALRLGRRRDDADDDVRRRYDVVLEALVDGGDVGRRVRRRRRVRDVVAQQDAALAVRLLLEVSL